MKVRVVLPLPLDEAYTYLVPPELEDEARVGCRVLVPFGPRRLTGLIVAHGGGEGVDDRKLRPIQDVLDAEPAFTGEMLRLTRWIADYYVCGWGEVVKAALPSGTESETRRRLVATGRAAGAWGDHPVARRVLAYVDAHENPTLAGLRQSVRGAGLALVRRLAADGLLTIEEEVQAPKVRIKYERHLRLADAFQTPSAARDLAAGLRGAKQTAVVEALAAFDGEGEAVPSQAAVLARAEASAATVNTLVERGVVEVVEREVIRTPLGDAPATAPAVHALHPAQARALEKVAAAAEAGRFEAFLLHGITGSGKTEVYIQALKDVLARGKTGIILVPEIALTPQTVRRFRAHFGDRIAVLHSRMSLGERYDAWRHLRSGRFDVVIGPRSAILAPLANIGLIVVDEEHESSYKQFDPAPRYHARDVAVMRAHMNDAVCILGSATPSIESWTNAHAGKYTLLSMPVRVPVAGRDAAPLPPVQIVDLTLERKKHRLHGAFSETLRAAIETRLGRGEQVILLQNRRGYAPIVECKGCGWAPTCPDCSVTLTYHKTKRHLRCHYCGRAVRVPRVCPSCNEPELAPLGTGTQRVEEELAALFPDARLLRMDLDTTGRKDAHHTLLSRFGRGEADVLIGTQMVAKGLDFPRVTLVGVINADAGLLLPDFRAEERTFQLLTQVAGRAGRADLRGEVVLQTRNPDHPALRFARDHDYVGFAEVALGDRRLLGYPPFGRIAAVEFRGPEEATVKRVAEAWTEAFRPLAPDFDLLGPSPAFVGRVKRQYRYHTLIKVPRGPGVPDVQPLLRHASATYGQPPKGYRIAVDVDAVGLF